MVPVNLSPASLSFNVGELVCLAKLTFQVPVGLMADWSSAALALTVQPATARVTARVIEWKLCVDFIVVNAIRGSVSYAEFDSFASESSRANGQIGSLLCLDSKSGRGTTRSEEHTSELQS